MLLNDFEITALLGMIDPFHPAQISQVAGIPAISFGLSSYGYDIRLSPRDFRVSRPTGKVLDPKNYDLAHLETQKLQSDEHGEFFVIPSKTSCLGVAIERFNIPDDVLVVCLDKSTYARSFLITNVTPAEPGWRGHLTLEISNTGSSPCRVYANEGIIQCLFFRGNPCGVSYDDRLGKYQDQGEEITLPRILGSSLLRRI